MESDDLVTSRRLFLKAATLCAGISLATPYRTAVFGAQQSDNDGDLARHLLDLVNAERAAAGLSRLTIDDLAASVARQHATEMAAGQFLSHWSRDGCKPYHRYSMAGGFDAVAENVSAAQNIESVDPETVRITLTECHVRMLSESPPNDGHRRTILAPQHTHVGSGIALSGHDLRLVELFVAKHVWLAPYQTRATPNALIRFKGKLLNPKHTLEYVEVLFEPPPSPRDIAWLREPRSYGLPDDSVVLRPVLYTGRYADGTHGVVDATHDGRFQFSVRLNKKSAGIYTVVIWIGRGTRQRFQATNACIQAG